MGDDVLASVDILYTLEFIVQQAVLNPASTDRCFHYFTCGCGVVTCLFSRCFPPFPRLFTSGNGHDDFTIYMRGIRKKE